MLVANENERSCACVSPAVSAVASHTLGGLLRCVQDRAGVEHVHLQETTVLSTVGVQSDCPGSLHDSPGRPGSHNESVGPSSSNSLRGPRHGQFQAQFSGLLNLVTSEQQRVPRTAPRAFRNWKSPPMLKYTCSPYTMDRGHANSSSDECALPQMGKRTPASCWRRPERHRRQNLHTGRNCPRRWGRKGTTHPSRAGAAVHLRAMKDQN